jgi:hypothetical protein
MQVVDLQRSFIGDQWDFSEISGVAPLIPTGRGDRRDWNSFTSTAV